MRRPDVTCLQNGSPAVQNTSMDGTIRMAERNIDIQPQQRLHVDSIPHWQKIQFISDVVTRVFEMV